MAAGTYCIRAPQGSPACRAALLDRFGFFGLRLSVRLVQSGVATTATALSRELSARAGLAPLRDALTGRFAGRADVLKARSALLAVDAVLQRWPVPAAAGLRHEYERITAGAHEFAEIRLLAELSGLFRGDALFAQVGGGSCCAGL